MNETKFCIDRNRKMYKEVIERDRKSYREQKELTIMLISRITIIISSLLVGGGGGGDGEMLIEMLTKKVKRQTNKTKTKIATY